MGSIIADIVDEIDVKPNKTKLILKWVIGISGSLIATAFLLGQLKTKHINRLDRIDTKLVEIKLDQNNGFNAVNGRIDKVYDDGIKAFNDFQDYNNKQLELIIDFGGDNKELLKSLLELNATEKENSVEREMEEAKKESTIYQPNDLSIAVTPIKNKPYMSEIHFIEVEGKDTVFGLSGATLKYINSIDKNKYEIGAVIDSDQYPGRFDVSYRNK